MLTFNVSLGQVKQQNKGIRLSGFFLIFIWRAQKKKTFKPALIFGEWKNLECSRKESIIPKGKLLWNPTQKILETVYFLQDFSDISDLLNSFNSK